MAARSKHLHSTVTPQTYDAVMDAANLWGDSVSLTVDKLVQRGLEHLEGELGSNTPAHVKLARVKRELEGMMSDQDNLKESLHLAQKLGDKMREDRVRAVASELGVEL